MLKSMISPSLLVVAGVLIPAPLFGGSFTSDFNSGLPPGTAVYGNTFVDSTGGVGGSGVLKLTVNANSLQGSFVINDLDAGSPVNSVDATFRLRLGGGTGTPADGMSFCVASDLPTAAWGEEGPTPITGLTVSFDIYVNTDQGETSPAIDLKWNGTVFASTLVPISFLRSGTEFWPVHIKMYSDGSLDLTYNGSNVYSGVVIPGFTPITGAKYGFGARTGGLNENQWVDDLSITTTTGGITPKLVRQPSDVLVLENNGAKFYPAVNNLTAGFSYQWQQKGPVDPDFADIPGANALALESAPLTLADSGTGYRLIVSGGGITLTSAVAVATVTTMTLPSSWGYVFDFFQQPADSTVFGTATVTPTGGILDSGVLRLTEAVNSQSGAFVVSDPFLTVPIAGMVANFKLRMGSGTTPPADGFSLNWATDIPDAAIVAAEEGAGTGLSVCFDVYEGANVPKTTVKWFGTNVSLVRLPLEYMQTGAEFVDVIVMLETNGNVTVSFDGIVLHNQVHLPGFTALANARWGLAARTGGLNQLHYVDDLQLAVTEYTGLLAFVREPQDTLVLVGRSATFSVEVNDPANATYQWQKQAPGEADFTDIPGATGTSYTTPPTTGADDGTLIRCVATSFVNPTNSTAAVLSVLDLTPPAAPNVCFDFNDGQPPADTAVFGTARVEATGGVGGSGVLKITDAINDQIGSFIINNFNGAEAVDGFTVAFDARIGGGTATPADGFSFSVSTDIPDGTVGEAENGTGTGLVVAFDIYNNGNAEAPAIDVKWGGVFIATTPVPLATIETGNDYRTALIRVNTNGTLDVVYGEQIIYHQLPLPGFQETSGLRWMLAARTGGANENHWFDNVCIETHRYVGPFFVRTEPADAVGLETATVTFTVEVNDPSQASFQWQKKAPGDADFSDIPGATASSYTTPALASSDDGTLFQVVITGTASTITSRKATLTVVPIPTVTFPVISFDFNDGAVPAGSAVFGNGASVSATAGVGGSGGIILTYPAEGLNGSFIINDPDLGFQVIGMTALFRLAIGGGTAVPADGVSFCWASDLADGAFGEDGAGSGLVISFDTYDNGGGEAPAIDVLWGGVQLGHTSVPIATLTQYPEFVDVAVRVNPNQTVDVVFDNQLIYYQLPVPAFMGMAGGRFGWGARTGGSTEYAILDDIQIETVVGVFPTLSITREGGNVVVTFEGVLQSSSNVSGPYTDVLGATSPYTVTPTEETTFYRARN